MNRNSLVALAASALVAASAMSVGHVAAADGVIVAPKAGQAVVVPQSYVVVPPTTTVQTQNPVVIWDEEYTRESQVVLVDPNGRSFKTTARFRPDGTMILPPDSAALPAGTVLHRPSSTVQYSEVYKVYDCGIINSNQEWDACGLNPQQ